MTDTLPPHIIDPRYRTLPLIRRLWSGYLRPHAGGMALVFVLMMVEGGTLGVLSRMLQPLFDRVFGAGESGLIFWVGLGIMALFVLRATMLVISRFMLTRISTRLSTAMQGDLLEHILKLDSPFFQSNSPGQLIERVQGDTNAVQQVWIMLLQGIGRDAFSLVSLFAVTLWIDPYWTMAALTGVPLLIVPSIIVQKYVRRRTASIRHDAGLRATRLDEIFHGITPIKLNRMEAYQVGRFRRIIDRIVNAEVKTATSRVMIPALTDIITGIGFFAVLILGGREILAGEKTVGDFMAFFTAMALMFQPLRRLGELSGSLQVASASLERVYTLFDTVPPPPPENPLPVPAGPLRITLENVHHGYGETPVLRGLSFTAEAGQTTALVGASGAGKSTVFNLLTRLTEPASGRITLGGADLARIPLEEARAVFSVVTQDAALFDETLRENITLGRGGHSEAEVTAALRAAHADIFVEALPRGLDTPAGPRGSGLSGGQRQRIAIARALLRDTPVLLLDEATSALDAASEVAVQQALETLSEGRTTLVIAHRLSTIRNADKIVVIDAGRVVEEGRHDDLLARDGAYAQLYRLQFRDQDQPA